MPMNPYRKLTLLFLSLSIHYTLVAQDTLPSFSVINRSSKVIISWANNYPLVKQLTIQRSTDSLKNFKSILTVPDPNAKTNGYLDSKAPDTLQFYRIYLLLDSNKYLFSKSFRPKRPDPLKEKALEKSYTVNKNNQVTFNKSDGGVMIDSLAGKINGKREIFSPSSFIYTNADGNVVIALPHNLYKEYTVKFYEDLGTFLFEIKDIPDSLFTLDKANFHHAGWFRFELFEKGTLKEKHKFQIPKTR
jgi:hypothetical protein